jgi:hypothetical protein
MLNKIDFFIFPPKEKAQRMGAGQCAGKAKSNLLDLQIDARNCAAWLRGAISAADDMSHCRFRFRRNAY